MNFVKQYQHQYRRDIVNDLLVILVLVKFSLEYMFRQGGLSPAFGLTILIAGIIAVVVRIGFFGSLLSFIAVMLFLIDINLQGNPNSAILFGILTTVALILYFFMKMFSR